MEMESVLIKNIKLEYTDIQMIKSMFELLSETLPVKIETYENGDETLLTILFELKNKDIYINFFFKNYKLILIHYQEYLK
jgi:hypothetical protein